MPTVGPGAGKRKNQALTKLANRAPKVAVASKPGSQPKVGVMGNAGGTTALKPQGRQGVKTQRPSRTGREFPGGKKGGPSTSGKRRSRSY